MINFLIPYSLFKLLEKPHPFPRRGAPTYDNGRATIQGCLPRKRDVLAHLHPSNKCPFFLTKWFLIAQSKSDVHEGALRVAKLYHSRVPRRPTLPVWDLQWALRLHHFTVESPNFLKFSCSLLQLNSLSLVTHFTEIPHCSPLHMNGNPTSSLQIQTW